MFEAKHLGLFGRRQRLEVLRSSRADPLYFTRTQQSPWVTKGSVMLVAASHPSLVTKPSQGLANLTLTRPERATPATISQL